MRTTSWVLMAFLTGPAGAWAGQEPPVSPEPASEAQVPSAGPPEPAPASAPASGGEGAESQVELGLGTKLAAGIGFSHPLGAAFRVQLLHGLSADVREEDGRVRAVCALPIRHCAKGFLLEAEGGSGGGKLSFGFGARARVEEEDFRGGAGISLLASLARTWGSPFGTEPGLTYLGPELDLSFQHVELGIGVLWRVAGDGGSGALLSWRLGFGL